MKRKTRRPKTTWVTTMMTGEPYLRLVCFKDPEEKQHMIELTTDHIRYCWLDAKRARAMARWLERAADWIEEGGK